MGIDLIAGGRRVGHNTRRAPESKNVYLKLLFKLFRCVFDDVNVLILFNYILIASWHAELIQSLQILLPRDCACRSLTELPSPFLVCRDT